MPGEKGKDRVVRFDRRIPEAVGEAAETDEALEPVRLMADQADQAVDGEDIGMRRWLSGLRPSFRPKAR
jgi:hypothetical protein